MAQDFGATIKQIAAVRQQKGMLSTGIYTERENIKRNQYLLDAMLAHNQDGRDYTEQIAASQKKIDALTPQFQESTQAEIGLVKTLQESFGGYKGLVNQLNDRYPVLFFPLRIETTFNQAGNTYQLWLRIFPDEITVDTHEEQLTQSEIDEGQQYWNSFAATNDPIAQGQAWDLVCRSFGAERAAWVVLKTDPSNPPPGPPKADSWTKQPLTRVLPDAFVIYAYDHSGNIVTAQTANVPDELKMGIDPSLDPDDPATPPSFTQDNNNDIVANDEVKWMVDFDAAIAKGMAAKITISQDQYNNGFDKILVLGVKSSLAPNDGKARLEQLITAHHYTDGFSLLKQGTGTNNTDTTYSGYSSVDFGNTTTYTTERKDPLYTPVYIQRQKKDGQLLCEALGIEYDLMYHIFHSDGSDISAAMNINTLLFQSSVGYFVNEMLTPFPNRRSNNNELRSFFTDYVRARGALPSIRSGVQPYGILPASVYSRINWANDPNAGLYTKISRVTALLDKQWTGVLSTHTARKVMASPPSGVTQQLSDILAQGPVSDSYIQRVGVGAGYVWNNLAYAALEYPEQRQEWLAQQTERMQGLTEQTGLNLKPDAKILQVNYLEQQSSITIPVVADEHTPVDAPLPPLGDSGFNMLQLMNVARFDDLRDENFEPYGVPDDIVSNQLRNNLLYRYVRQSLMLEYFEAACDLLRIPDDQRQDPELVNIVNGASPPGGQQFENASPPGEMGEMGRLSYGPSRLLVMQTPFNGFKTVAEFLDQGEFDQFPEATQHLVTARGALDAIAFSKVRELNLLTAELIDTTSFRLDTWRLSLVNQRLNDLRGIKDGSSSRSTGIYLGAYGWVTDVRPNTSRHTVAPPTPNFSGSILYDEKNKGYIHTPSINQAVNAAVLRSGYGNRADQNSSDPLSVNLSSERVRRALDIMDAISNGQELGVLLGYELERRLHDQGIHAGIELDKFIQPLRDHFSQNNTIVENTPDIIQKVKARNVVNGIMLIEKYKASGIAGVISEAQLNVFPYNITPVQSAAIQQEIDWIWNLMDAIADIAMSEGMFQIVQGNQVKGGAVADAIGKGKLIAEPDVVDSPKTGTPVNQRFSMHFSNDTTLTNGWNYAMPLVITPRALAEPFLNKWLISLLPAPADISCMVNINGTASQVAVSVKDLGLQPIDLMYLMPEVLESDDSMLSQHIKRFVRKEHNYDVHTTLAIRYDLGSYSFAEVLPVLRYARKLATASRPLNTLDYITPYEADGAICEYDITDLHDRAFHAADDFDTAVGEVSNKLNAASFDPKLLNDALYVLSGYGMEQTIYEFYQDTDTANEEILKAWAGAVLGIAATRQTQLNAMDITVPAAPDGNQAYYNTIKDYLGIIYGAEFVVLPKFNIRAAEQAMLAPAFNLSSTLLMDHQSNNLLTDEWLGSIARVRKNAASYEILSFLASAINFDSFYNRPVKALQLPYSSVGNDRWLGASVTSTDAVRPGYVAIGASMPSGNTVTAWQVGLMVEEWIDVIPNKEETTGIAFHHDQPNAKAPQCLILGLTPQITGRWQLQDLVDMMNETFDMAQKRGVDFETISGTAVGQLSASMLMPAAQSGNVIGLSGLHLTSI